MLEIDYEIKPKLEYVSRDDIVDDMEKARDAIDAVFSDLYDLPECGEVFLWKNNEDHVYFQFDYDKDGGYVATIKDLSIQIKSGHFDDGSEIETDKERLTDLLLKFGLTVKTSDHNTFCCIEECEKFTTLEEVKNSPCCDERIEGHEDVAFYDIEEEHRCVCDFKFDEKGKFVMVNW